MPAKQNYCRHSDVIKLDCFAWLQNKLTKNCDWIIKSQNNNCIILPFSLLLVCWITSLTSAGHLFSERVGALPVLIFSAIFVALFSVSFIFVESLLQNMISFLLFFQMWEVSWVSVHFWGCSWDSPFVSLSFVFEIFPPVP